jgi:hypothetical protein
MTASMRARSQHQRGLSIPIAGINVCSGSKQLNNDLYIGSLYRVFPIPIHLAAN